MTDLILYDQARRALDNARRVDEVKDILDKAKAMRCYAMQAQDRSLEADAAEIRFRAERRLGQMIAAQKETVGLNRGRAGAGRPALGGAALGGARDEPPKIDPRPTLADAGIDKKLSAHAQKMAAVPAEQFDHLLGEYRTTLLDAGERLSTNLLKIGEEERQRQARRELAQALSDTSLALKGYRQVPCIYADPAWKRKAGDGNRSYENHYPTATWDDIMRLPVKDLLLPDAWGFIWIPRAHMLALHPVAYDVEVPGTGEVVEAKVPTPLIWAIARAWGFDDYSTCFVWTKTDDEHPDEIGTGLVVRDQDEILCLFKRGRGLPKPANAEKFSSNHRERAGRHSAKPQFYREMIAAMNGGVPTLELFARFDADNPLPTNWASWGNEAQPGEGEEAA